MKDRNEVIRALKCCIEDEDLPCEGNCPYFGEDGCVDKVMADALELLEDQPHKHFPNGDANNFLEENNMKTYICTKVINAVPAKLVNGCPWPDGLPLPEISEPAKISEHCGNTCEVHIEDGYMFTTSKDDRYPQYMSAAEFEKICRSTEAMTFGDALVALKQGKRVARKGWNGKNMSVAYQKGYPEGIPCNKNTAQAWGMEEGELFKCRPYLQMRCADGTFQMWLASQSDILADDWYIV